MKKIKMVKNIALKDETTTFLIYTAPREDVKVEAFLHNENIWLTQKKMSELFVVDRTVITKIKKLERTVSSFFDYIERIIENRIFLKMEDLAKSVNKFLEFNEFEVLEGKGHLSFEDASKKAFKEYDEFNKHQQIDSDFDKFSRKLLGDRKNARYRN